MESGRIITSLIVCTLFWTAVVLLLLLSRGEFNNPAIATPVPEDSLNILDSAINTSHPETIFPAETEMLPVAYSEISGEIKRGESLDQAMKRLEISDSARISVINGFAKTLDFKELQPGDRLTVRVDQDNDLTTAIYTSGPLNIHILERSEDGSYQASRQAVELECRIEKISGSIGSSLYAAFSTLGESPKLIHAFADIFASKIDFNTETRVGDAFSLLVEKYYKDGDFVGYGKILVARYQKETVSYVGYHYVSGNTPAGYFDENGEALGTWFIRSPIPFGRVTSRFSRHRKHPIDGVVRPHLGVDLAAPVGTPVMATADGKVEFVGRRGGFGKTVILRHNGGYKTYYGHLNSYKKGLGAGSTVAQKDIIGYVGSTGISTGPHLDYRIQYNGIFKNPFAIKFKAKTVLKDAELTAFRQKSAETAVLFNTSAGENVLQAKKVILSEENRISFL